MRKTIDNMESKEKSLESNLTGSLGKLFVLLDFFLSVKNGKNNMLF